VAGEETWQGSHTGEGFLAPPGHVADWRGVLLIDVARDAGLLDALPGAASAVADRLGLSARAVRIVLDALREFEVVELAGDEYVLGLAAPDDAAAAALRHHARVVRAWSAELADRLHTDTATRGGRSADELAQWLRSLGATARHRAPELVDRCLRRFPDARRVLDLAGGHGEYGLAFARRGLDVTLQDLPRVIDIVGRWDTIRESPVRLVAADAFDELAAGPFDLVVCTGFNHTLKPEANAELFGRIAGIVAAGGGVAVSTFVRGRRPTSPLFAVQMLVAGGGGDTHGLEEYRNWLAAAGFESPQVEDSPGGPTLLTAHRSRTAATRLASRLRNVP
jgi:hypothetical protein